MRVHLFYHSRFYLGESMDEKKLNKIKRKIEEHPLRHGYFLITTARNGVDQLEIFSCRLLAQSYYQKNPPYVIGIASDYDEALGILKRIVEECLKERGDCLLREYLEC